MPNCAFLQFFHSNVLDEFLGRISGKFRTLADPTCLAILHCLMQGERDVTQVVEGTGRSQAHVSKHLEMLAESGLVGRKKAGLHAFCRLDDSIVGRLCELLREAILREAILREARVGVIRGAKLLEDRPPPG